MISTPQALRVFRVQSGTLKNGWKEVWEVLAPDLRTQEFTGSHEECVQYIRNQCPNGSCEE